MKLYRLNTAQHFPITIGDAWGFFSNPKNLTHITPPSLGLEITSELPAKMYPGMIITYSVRTIIGIPMNWVTEITHVDEPNLFIDEQRFGPYRFWHHQHLFQEIEGGTQMRDIVHYALPFGLFGRFINALLIGKQLNGIFNFRRQFLEQRFGTICYHGLVQSPDQD
jgi:ligand-binding SRPBCC domain-containing protein